MKRLWRSNALSAGAGALGTCVVLGLLGMNQQRALIVGLTPEQQQILGYMSVECLEDGDGGLVETVRFSGVNVQIVNGLEATNGNPADPLSLSGTTNGLGNLLIGYNEPGIPGDLRTGSHNLVVGPRHGYRSFGGALIGQQNRVFSPYGSVTAGFNNLVTGFYGSVSGGSSNTASGQETSACGGQGNQAIVFGSWIGGGFGNRANGFASAISGGLYNETRHDYSSVSGGQSNLASGGAASVSGGIGNQALELGATVSGGSGNVASGIYSTVDGGCSRTNDAFCGHSP